MTDDLFARRLPALLAEHPELDGPTELVVERLKRIAGHVDRLLAASLAAHDLTRADWKVLVHLVWAESPPTAAELAAASGLTKGTMSVRLDRLEERGILRRKSSGADRRAQHVTLTARGRRVWNAVVRDQATRERAFLETIAPDDVDRLARLLGPLSLAVEHIV